MHLANYFYLAVALSLLSLSIASLSMPAVAVGVLELPSSGAPNAVCVNGSRVYVFGFENSSGYPRLFAARLGLGGSVERVYIGGFGGFYNCVVYGDRVISVGVANSSSIAWLIAVFDAQLNLLESVVEDLTPGVDVATHVFIANNRLIVAGAGDKYGNAFIRVEERDLRSLELLRAFNISIGKGKDYSYTLTPRGGVATLIYSVDGDAKTLTLSSDLKVLWVWDLGKGVEVLDAKWINDCLYIASKNEVLRLCSSEPSKSFYVGGGHPVAVEATGNGVAALVLIPRYIDRCSAKLLLISKDLGTATEYTVSENALCIHYMKPIGFAGNMAIVAVSEKGVGWRVELLQLGTAKEVDVESPVIVIPLEPFIAVVVITALALSIAVDRLMEAKQRSDQSTNEHAELEAQNPRHS